MKKPIVYILAVFGAVFVYYLLRAVWGGFSSTAAPNKMVQKAKCVAECRKNALSENCDQYCLDQSFNQ
ncbi:MAG: hypothetical protein AAB574_00475 [Patescibacteria group bacterium]